MISWQDTSKEIIHNPNTAIFCRENFVKTEIYEKNLYCTFMNCLLKIFTGFLKKVFYANQYYDKQRCFLVNVLYVKQ